MKLMEAKGSRRSAAVKRVRRPRRASVVAALVALALSVVTVAYASSLVLTPSYDWYTKDPSASSYEVATAPEMLGLAYLTNGLADLDGDGAAEPAVDFSGKTINQTADITFRSASGYIPAGTPEHPFNGTFNGQGHQITNLTIDCGSESTPAAKAADGTTTPATTTTCYVGLFGYCGADSTLENVTVGNTVAIRVVDPVTSATGATGALDEAVTADTVIHDVGSLVGYTEGSVSGVTSYATVTATNNLAATDNDPEVVLNVGGIAGTIEGSLTSCAGAGNIAVTAPTLAPDTQDCVVANVGGLVGTLGAATADGRSSHAGTITNCTYGYSDDSGYFGIGTTQVTLHVVTTGVGGLDRFGVEKEATSISVGGIAGYSYGSIANCTNYALVNTNSADARLYKNSQGLVRIVKSDELTPDTYPAAEDLFAIANGGSGVGGVVGTMRAGGMSAEGVERTDVGSADNAITLTQSFNMGTVVGLAHTGGIAGSVGSYAAIDSCRNGKVSAKGTGTTDDCGHVVTTRWNKPMTGGIVGATYSNVSNCCNLSEVENIQTGYYTAGIVGSLRSPDDYTAECYACFNSGQVHVSSYATQSYREAGLVGNNAGYLHDSVMRSGCVLAHDDDEATYPNAAIGDDSWGMWSNVTFASTSDLKKSETAAVLNAAHAQDVLTLPEQDWTYWYISSVGYPVLNVWDEPTDRADLTSANVSATCVTLAEYAGTSEAIPDLIVTYTAADGTQSVLVQNVDYYVIPQKGACAMTSLDADATPYQASIIGIGNYQGTVQNVCRYGIGPCDLSNCSVSTSSESYDFGTQVYPDEVYVMNPAGVRLDASEYRYEIYDGSTYALNTGNQKRGVLFDSAGYVSWDGGATRQTVASQHDRLCSDLTGIDYILYNADGEAIFKIEGGTPGQANGTSYEIDPLTGAETENLGLSYYKAAVAGVSGGGLAGYIIKVSPTASSTTLKQDTWTTGQYVVNPIDLYQEAKIEQVQVTLPTADGTSTYTETWYWDKTSSTLYKLDDQGNPVRNSDGSLKQAAVTFTGGEIDPTATITYTKENGETVTIPQDISQGYNLIYGDPYTKKIDLAYTNRDATPVSDPGDDATEEEKSLYDLLKDHEKAAVTAKANINWRYSNYVHMYFTIDPVDLSDCTVAVPGAVEEGLATYAYRGGYGVRPTVAVTRCGNTLVSGTDYKITYENNTEPTTQEALDAYYATGDTSGLASYTVTGLGNVIGEQTTYFAIAPGMSLTEQGYTISPIADEQYNFGYGVEPTGGITLLDKDGQPATLVEGEDYTVTYDNNTNVGVARVIVKGVNAYTGQLTASFNVTEFDVSDPANADRVTLVWENNCTADAVQYRNGPGFHVVAKPIVDYATGAYGNDQWVAMNWTATNLVTGETYSYDVPSQSGSTLLTPGEYEVTAQCVGNWFLDDRTRHRYTCTGDLTQAITVVKANIADADLWTSTPTNFTYSRSAQEPTSIKAHIGEGQWNQPGAWVDMADLGCTLTYRDNIQAGTAQCTIQVPSSNPYYTGSYVYTYEIAKLDLADATVLVQDQLYTGEYLTPDVTVKVGDVTLVQGEDYTLEYTNNKSKGTATVTVTAIGSCTGKAQATFSIGTKLNIAQADIDAIPAQLYTGAAVTPKPIIRYNDQVLTEGTDYTLTYTNNVQQTTEKAHATVTIKGAGTFAGTTTSATFDIVSKIDISQASCAIPDQVYTGSPLTPTTQVVYDGATLTQGVDYTVEYRRNIKAGAPARAVVTGIGSYEGELVVPFNIVVGKCAITKFGENAKDAVSLSLQVAQSSYPAGADAVVIAWWKDYDAQIQAAQLAADLGCPVLVCMTSGLTTSQDAYLRQSVPAHTYVVTSDDAFAQTASSQAVAMGSVATRVEVDPSSSSLALAQQSKDQTVAVVANPADLTMAFAALSYANAKGYALLLTASDGTLSQEQSAWLAQRDRIVIAGRFDQVDASLESALASTTASRVDAVANLAQLAIDDGVSANGAVVVDAGRIDKNMTASGLSLQSGSLFLPVEDDELDFVEALSQATRPAYGVVTVGLADDLAVYVANDTSVVASCLSLSASATLESTQSSVAADGDQDQTLTLDGVDYTYTIADGEATITHIQKSADNAAATYEARIPESIAVDGKTYLVTAIGNNVMGTSYSSASSNDQLTAVTIPAKCLSIGDEAFLGCSKLTDLEFAADDDGTQHLESIGARAFYQTSPERIILPDTVASVGDRAFAFCGKVSELHIPATHTTWGDTVFASCSPAQVDVPDGCVILPEVFGTFASIDLPGTLQGTVRIGSGNLNDVHFGDGIQIDTLYLAFGTLESLEIPATVRTLSLEGTCASATIPATVTNIIRYLVEGPEEYVIPATVTDIGTMAFAYNKTLKRVTFEPGSQLSSIGDYAFSGCSELESVDLTEGLTMLGSFMFRDCSSLESIVIPASVSDWGNTPFDDCASLREIRFATQSKLVNLESRTIARDCPSLVRVYLPDGLSRVTDDATNLHQLFVDCASLADVFVYNPDLQLNVNAFSGCGDVTVHGWGTEGAVIDFCEDEGYAFQPLAELDSSAYSGAANTQFATVSGGSIIATCTYSSSTSYDYAWNPEAGTDYSVTVTRYDGVEVAHVTGNELSCFGAVDVVIGADLMEAVVDSVPTQFLADSPCTPHPHVSIDGVTLVEGRDYAVAYQDNDVPGEATMTVQAVGACTGSLTAAFTVKRIDTTVASLAEEHSDLLGAIDDLQKITDETKCAVVVNPGDKTVVAAAAAYTSASGAALILTQADGTLDSSTISQLSGLDAVSIVGTYADVDASVDGALPHATRVGSASATEAINALTRQGLDAGMFAQTSRMIVLDVCAPHLSAVAFNAAAGAPLLVVDSQDMAKTSAAIGAVSAFDVSIFASSQDAATSLAARVRTAM